MCIRDSPKDEKNRSQGALLYNKTYGQYDAIFLKEDSNEVYLLSLIHI